jgi:hypothetical protein
VLNLKDKPYLNEKFKLPLFIPVQIIDNNVLASDLREMNKYILDEVTIIYSNSNV